MAASPRWTSWSRDRRRDRSLGLDHHRPGPREQLANATGDHQWIHVDLERAKDSPFGGTIVHGYLTLSLLPHFTGQLFALDTPGAKLNYGTNKVRFPAPLPVGSKVRATASIAEVSETKAGTQLVTKYTIEVEGSDKPACVAETVVLLLS